MKHPSNIEFSALRIFAAAADAETMTKAAERLGITQSAVSQAIQQLEKQTGVELIIKRSRPLKLTQSGDILRVYANRMLSESRRLLNDVKLASAGDLPAMAVGMIDSFADALGLEFVTAIDPMMSKISLQTGLHTSLSTALRNRDIDLLITSDQSDNSPLLERHALVRDLF